MKLRTTWDTKSRTLKLLGRRPGKDTEVGRILRRIALQDQTASSFGPPSNRPGTPPGSEIARGPAPEALKGCRKLKQRQQKCRRSPSLLSRWTKPKSKTFMTSLKKFLETATVWSTWRKKKSFPKVVTGRLSKVRHPSLIEFFKL